MKFKIGDSVAVYHSFEDIPFRTTGTVHSCIDGRVRVTASYENETIELVVHPNQCRRLLGKQKRKRIWVNVWELETLTREPGKAIHNWGFGAPRDPENYYELLEVRRKKK